MKEHSVYSSLRTNISQEVVKAHEKTVLDFFGITYSWDETGYLTVSGKRVDFSGKHDGGFGGYRTVDHRDVREALGLDYGGKEYSGGMVAFMQEGNIRIAPEVGGINLSIEPTKEQYAALERYITRARGEVILDLDDDNGNTVSSTEYPRGTSSKKVISDIKAYFESGAEPVVSQVAQFHYQLRETISNRQRLAEAYDTLAQSKVEKTRLAEYRENIDKMEAMEQHLTEVNREIRQLSFAKGERDTERIQTLREDAKMTEKNLNTMDGKLLRIGTLYFSLSNIWGWTYGEEIVGTLTAVDDCLGVLLGISSVQYNKK